MCVLRIVRVRGFSLFQSLLLRRVSPLSLAHQRLFLPGPHTHLGEYGQTGAGTGVVNTAIQGGKKPLVGLEHYT